MPASILTSCSICYRLCQSAFARLHQLLPRPPLERPPPNPELEPRAPDWAIAALTAGSRCWKVLQVLVLSSRPEGSQDTDARNTRLASYTAEGHPLTLLSVTSRGCPVRTPVPLVPTPCADNATEPCATVHKLQLVSRHQCPHLAPRHQTTGSACRHQCMQGSACGQRAMESRQQRAHTQNQMQLGYRHKGD